MVDSHPTSSKWFGELLTRVKSMYVHLRQKNSDQQQPDYLDVEKGYSPRSVYIDIKGDVINVINNGDGTQSTGRLCPK